MAGKAVELECLHVRERFHGTKAWYVWDRRLSAQIQKHPLAVQSAYAAVVRANLNSLRGDEAALAKDQFGPAFLVLVHVRADEAVHHPPLAGPDLRHFEQCRGRAAAEIAVMPNKIGHFRAMDDIFRRQAGDVRTRSPDEPALDNRSPQTFTGARPRGEFASHSAAENKDIEPFYFAHDLVLLLNGTG